MAAIQLAQDPGSNGQKSGLRCIRSTYQVGFTLFNQLPGLKVGVGSRKPRLKIAVKPVRLGFPENWEKRLI